MACGRNSFTTQSRRAVGDIEFLTAKEVVLTNTTKVLP